MFGLNTTQVALIEAAVAVLQTLLLVIGGAVAWRQLHEAQRTRYLGAIIRMFDDIGSRAAYEDADAALGLPHRIEDYTPEELELATWTTRVYEQLAFLVESGMIPEKYIVPLDSRRIVWTWDALQPYIQEQRRLRDSGGSYRISVRAAKGVDACAIARRLGGGGHTRAAGCELLGNLDNAKSAILAEVEAELDRPETQEES